MLGTLENSGIGRAIKKLPSSSLWANGDLQKPWNLPKVIHLVLDFRLEPRLPVLHNHEFFPSHCPWKESCFSQDLGCWLWWMGWNKTWFTGGGNGNLLQYSCLENTMNTMKRQKDMTLKDELPPGWKVSKYVTGEEWMAITNSSRKNEVPGQKQKWRWSCGYCLVMKVKSGDESSLFQ